MKSNPGKHREATRDAFVRHGYVCRQISLVIQELIKRISEITQRVPNFFMG